MVALDFRATCFMPRSFVGVALYKSRSQEPLGQAVAALFKHLLSEDVSALLSASNHLVQFGQQEVGKYSFLSLFPYFN